jgi:hypothetical protein
MNSSPVIIELIADADKESAKPIFDATAFQFSL